MLSLGCGVANESYLSWYSLSQWGFYLFLQWVCIIFTETKVSFSKTRLVSSNTYIRNRRKDAFLLLELTIGIILNHSRFVSSFLIMKRLSHHPGTVTLNCRTARSQLVISQLLPKTLMMLVCKLATYKPDMRLRPPLALSLHTPICSTDFLD